MKPWYCFFFVLLLFVCSRGRVCINFNRINLVIGIRPYPIVMDERDRLDIAQSVESCAMHISQRWLFSVSADCDITYSWRPEGFVMLLGSPKMSIVQLGETGCLEKTSGVS